MAVYVEDIFLDNFVIDLIILFITGKLLRLKLSVLRLVLGAVCGVFFVVLNLVFGLSGILLIVFKLCCGFLIVCTAFKTYSFKKLMLCFCTFLIVTFLMGGALLMFASALGNTIISETGEIFYDVSLPMWLVLSTICILFFTFMQIWRHIKKSTLKSEFVFDATLTNCEKQICVKAFMDTGNLLLDPISKKPVIFITYNNFKKLFNVSLEEIMLKNSKSVRYIKTGSINASSDILVVNLEKLTLKQNKKTYLFNDIPLGLTFKKLEKQLNCSLLLNINLFNGEFYEQT